MANDSTLQELKALSRLISQSIDAIEGTLQSRGQKFPSLSEPFSTESEASRMAADVLDECSVITAAAAQLVAAVRPPTATAMFAITEYQISSALRSAIQMHIPEIVREAGPQGIHVNDIAAKIGVDSNKLARSLRLLAVNYIFVEVAPDVFAHNRISSVLDTGKPANAVIQDPENKHENTPGFVALLELFGHHHFKASAFMYEALTTKEKKLGDNIGFNVAFNTPLPFFAWLHQPGNVYNQKLLDKAMAGIQVILGPEASVSGLDYLGELPSGATIVDVGGGIGRNTFLFTKKYPHLNYIVQDQEATIQGAKKFWTAKAPEALTSGKVKLEVHNFLEKQPVKAPAVFYLSLILHDWHDEICVKILRQLRDSAGPETQLVIADTIMSYTCQDPPTQIEGTDTISWPAPLPPNGGHWGIYQYILDVTMMNTHNSLERTLLQFQDLLAKGGWKIVRVYKGAHRGMFIESKIIAVPL
jgi:hypothetical protein